MDVLEERREHRGGRRAAAGGDAEHDEERHAHGGEEPAGEGGEAGGEGGHGGREQEGHEQGRRVVRQIAQARADREADDAEQCGGAQDGQQLPAPVEGGRAQQGGGEDVARHAPRDAEVHQGGAHPVLVHGGRDVPDGEVRRGPVRRDELGERRRQRLLQRRAVRLGDEEHRARAPAAGLSGGETAHRRTVAYGLARVRRVGHGRDVEAARLGPLQYGVHVAGGGAARDDHMGVMGLGRVERRGETEQEAQEEGGREPDGLGEGPGPRRPGGVRHPAAVPLSVVAHALPPALSSRHRRSLSGSRSMYL
ncbi:hypothetical protein [Streptomyces murinus]|uniref:hypothetical protein n=1 Tax=Streptomyces murinus TaxID=33900 RepID=UPI0035C1A6E4